MHLANTVDNTYEWGIGWIRTVVVALIVALAVSAAEANSDWNLWELTVEWFYGEVEAFGNWVVDSVTQTCVVTLRVIKDSILERIETALGEYPERIA